MIKRYDFTCGKDQRWVEWDGEFITYADHAALIEKVREIAEGMEHMSLCDTWNPGVNDGCTCPRGKLLALCDSSRGGEHG